MLTKYAATFFKYSNIILFFQCGYFKRHRPNQEPTDEAARPLQSNGNGRSNGHSIIVTSSSNGNGRSNGHHNNGRNGHSSFNRPLYPGDEHLWRNRY